jgi:hypothetical protein
MFIGGGESEIEKFNIGLNVSLFFVFIFLLYANIIQDMQNKNKLNTIVCHKEVNLPKIRDADKLIIESVIEKYWKKRSMNKSNCVKIWNDMKFGFIRGALGGAIIGRDWEGTVSGAVVFSAISGLSKAYSLNYNKPSFLKDRKHT